MRLDGRIAASFLLRRSTRDHDAHSRMVHRHPREGTALERCSRRYTPLVHDRDPLLEILRPGDIEAVTQFLLDLATEGFLDEAEFWECWTRIEACREFHDLAGTGASVN